MCNMCSSELPGRRRTWVRASAQAACSCTRRLAAGARCAAFRFRAPTARRRPALPPLHPPRSPFFLLPATRELLSSLASKGGGRKPRTPARRRRLVGDGTGLCARRRRARARRAAAGEQSPRGPRRPARAGRETELRVLRPALFSAFSRERRAPGAARGGARGARRGAAREARREAERALGSAAPATRRSSGDAKMQNDEAAHFFNPARARKGGGRQ